MDNVGQEMGFRVVIPHFLLLLRKWGAFYTCSSLLRIASNRVSSWSSDPTQLQKDSASALATSSLSHPYLIRRHCRTAGGTDVLPTRKNRNTRTCFTTGFSGLSSFARHSEESAAFAQMTMRAFLLVLIVSTLVQAVLAQTKVSVR